MDIFRPVTTPSDVPKEPHYVVQVFRSVSTHNGWEDEGYTTSAIVIDHYCFIEKAQWERHVESLYAKDMNRKDIVAFEANPIKIEKKVALTFNKKFQKELAGFTRKSRID